MEALTVGLLMIAIVLLLAVIFLILRASGNSNSDEIAAGFYKKINSENARIREMIMQQQKIQGDFSLELSSALKDSLHSMGMELLKNNSEAQSKMQDTMIQTLKEIQNANDKRLYDIQNNVNEKLDKSLNERLDSSFKQIGDQLLTLYKSLGELQALSSGVADLQKTLSNVKTRGIFGEFQLRNILMDIMDSSQYEENVATKKKSSDRVEFAIKIPDKEDANGFIYLPVDSKFPADIYNKIVDASNNADSNGMKQSIKELEQRIKTEARTIRDKYIDPPNTTDFAIMFLPTEGLYAEAIRIAGLMEWCQNECKIVLSGPTTLVALLNSLSIGFRYLTVNKNSKEILKTLSAVKAQYQKFNQLIVKTQKKLQEAQSATDDLQSRNDMIQKKLSKVEMMDESDSSGVLGILEETAD
ncbi:MAG: DNA recombination protein RmuC [Eubacterium sp.]|nr:DNA recombination protein RmuC [Eubacterium sp.]